MAISTGELIVKVRAHLGDISIEPAVARVMRRRRRLIIAVAILVIANAFGFAYIVRDDLTNVSPPAAAQE